MKKKSIKALVMAMLVAVLLPTTVLADENVGGVFAGNIFEAGSVASVTDSKAKDIFVAGQDASVKSSSVSGNVFAAGSNVGVQDVYAGADVFIAGQNVTVSSASIEGSIMAAGQSLAISDVTSSGIAACGATINVIGSEADEVLLSGEKIVFDSIAYGDVNITGEDITIGENAKIAGKLTVNSSEEPIIRDESAIGTYDFNKVESDNQAEAAKKVTIFGRIIKKIASLGYWIPAGIIIALFLALLFGKNLDDAHALVKDKPAEMIITGLVMWAMLPVVLLVLAITIIGAPLAGIVGIVYLACIFLGLAFAGSSLGRMVLPNLHPILASIIGVAVFEIVRIVPLIGGLLGAAADMYLLGYVGMSIYNNFPRKKAVVYATAVETPIVNQTVVETTTEVAQIGETTAVETTNKDSESN